MLLAVVPVERYASRNALRFLDTEDWGFRDAARMARDEARHASILCLGDSQLKAGLLPQALEERTGRRALNLALIGGQVEAADSLFRTALENGARPEALVIDAFPKLLATPPSFNRWRWASMLGFGEALDMAWFANDPELFGSVALAKVLPTLRGRNALRDNVKAALEGRIDSRCWANFALLRQWRKNSGAAILHPTARGGEQDKATLDAWMVGYFSTLRVEPVHARAVERLLATALDRRVPVFWVLMPHLPAVQDYCEATGYDAAHRALLLGWQKRFPNLIVIDATRATDDPKAFYDPHHLSADGAYPFSVALGDVIREALDSPERPRMARLAAFRSRPLPGGIEDVEGTVAAIAELNSKRRRR